MPRNPPNMASTDAAIKPPNAPESRPPAYSIDVRSASSFFVYQHDSKYSAPGKNGLEMISLSVTIPRCTYASTKPSKNRTVVSPPKPDTKAVDPESRPQATIHPGRYSDGRTLVMSKFEGTCSPTYPTKNIDIAVLKLEPVRPRSASMPWTRAFASALRSK
jgi:hypothetical protein